MNQYDFRLSTGDQNAGTVYLPDEYSGTLPVLIYSHGWGDNRSLGPVLQRMLDKRLALVTFDYFGCGETGGDYSQMTYRRWKENLSGIITWISEQPFADMDKLGCGAFSSGSTSALRLAPEDQIYRFDRNLYQCTLRHEHRRTGKASGG